MIVFVVGAAITWRISSLLSANNREVGPWDIFAKFRDMMGVTYNGNSQCMGKRQPAKILCCLWCTSIYVGLAVSAIWGYSQGSDILWIIGMGLAFSAGAIMVQRYIES